MTEPDDPEVLAMRERAERVAQRRANERATAPAVEESRAKPKKKRKWYHWVLDTALFLLVAYMVKTRFFDKPKEPAPLPKAATAPASSLPPSGPSSAASVVTRASADVLEAAASASPRVDTVAPNTALEVLEVSPAGFVKVKTPSGKSGWLPATAVISR